MELQFNWPSEEYFLSHTLYIKLQFLKIALEKIKLPKQVAKSMFIFPLMKYYEDWIKKTKSAL